MKQPSRYLALSIVTAGAVLVSAGGTATADVVVRPNEVVSAGFQTFTVSVPNEKPIPTTSVRLVMPEGLKSVMPTQKAGWKIETDKQGSDEASTVRSITWSGGAINDGLRDEFGFSAQVPDRPTELQWKAYQTYADGSVVAWDKLDKGGSNDESQTSGSLSITKVVSATEADTAVQAADQAAARAETAARRALYVAVAGLVVGLAGMYLYVRKKR